MVLKFGCQNVDIMFKTDASEISMNSIETLITINGMTGSVGGTSQSNSHPVKLQAKDTFTQSAHHHAESHPLQTDISFSTYGSRNEHLAVVVTNKETGKVIREVPSQEMQKLHVHLDVVV